jgi:hypothetical protein
MEEDKTFFVGIDNPGEVRKDLLGCSKDIIGILKNYDNINSIREEKIGKIMELKKTIAEIKKLNMLLKSKLPTETVRATSSQKARKVRKKTAKKKGQNNQIKELESELSEIEDRLNNMTI